MSQPFDAPSNPHPRIHSRKFEGTTNTTTCPRARRATASASIGWTSPRVPCGARSTRMSVYSRRSGSIRRPGPAEAGHYLPMTHVATGTGRPAPLTPNQVRGFWAAWGGWALDGMDSFIYSLVLVPALTELLPRSGIEATPANIGYYGGMFLALFMMGYGTSMVWGPI